MPPAPSVRRHKSIETFWQNFAFIHFISYLLEILINKYSDNMHLICINYNSLNKQFSAKKIGVAILFTCVLTSMQNFAAIGPFGAEI